MSSLVIHAASVYFLAEKQTHRQKAVKKPTLATVEGVGNE